MGGPLRDSMEGIQVAPVGPLLVLMSYKRASYKRARLTLNPLLATFLAMSLLTKPTPAMTPCPTRPSIKAKQTGLPNTGMPTS